MITGIVWCGRTPQRSAANKRTWFHARHQALTESDGVAFGQVLMLVVSAFAILLHDLDRIQTGQ
jgi:hypothetical protein